MQRFIRMAQRLVRDDAGATLLEYGMLLMLITVLCIAAVTSIGNKVSVSYSQVDNALPS